MSVTTLLECLPIRPFVSYTVQFCFLVGREQLLHDSRFIPCLLTVFGEVEYPYKTAAERTAEKFGGKTKDANERYLDWIKTIKEEGDLAA